MGVRCPSKELQASRNWCKDNPWEVCFNISEQLQLNFNICRASAFLLLIIASHTTPSTHTTTLYSCSLQWGLSQRPLIIDHVTCLDHSLYSWSYNVHISTCSSFACMGFYLGSTMSSHSQNMIVGVNELGVNQCVKVYVCAYCTGMNCHPNECTLHPVILWWTLDPLWLWPTYWTWKNEWFYPQPKCSAPEIFVYWLLIQTHISFQSNRKSLQLTVGGSIECIKFHSRAINM